MFYFVFIYLIEKFLIYFGFINCFFFKKYIFVGFFIQQVLVYFDVLGQGVICVDNSSNDLEYEKMIRLNRV